MENQTDDSIKLTPAQFRHKLDKLLTKSNKDTNSKYGKLFYLFDQCEASGIDPLLHLSVLIQNKRNGGENV